MSEPGGDEAAAAAQTPASRLAAYVRGGGVVVPLLTVLLAFFVGGLVVLITGHDPISTYEAIFKGTGLQWLFPWPIEDRELAASNLQQTLINTTPLILTGLAVAFAFRAGLFNIGGQGQYIMGSIAAVWVASELPGMPGFLHIVLAVLAACVAGAVWAGIAGGLKASVGANEVISTIMLNYTALYVGLWAFGQGGPLQNDTDPSLPVSNEIVESTKLPVFWGEPLLQGLHIGIFVALVAAGIFWLILNRSTTGYEVRAVGLNPEAARYGGMSVAKNYVLVMAVCGVFAGLAGAIDVLGWQFRVATNDIEFTQIGFLGIAVALLGRNTAIGTVAAALLFGALITGTSQRNLDPTIFEPELAANLTTIIQGLVVLVVSADVLVLGHAAARPRGLLAQTPARGGRHVSGATMAAGRVGIAPKQLGWAGRRARRARVVHRAAAAAGANADPVAAARRARRGCRRVRDARRGAAAGLRRHRGRGAGRDRRGGGHQIGREQPRGRVRVVGADRGHAALRHPAGVRRARRHPVRAQRGDQHRPRGHDADGRLLRHLRRRRDRLVVPGRADRDGVGRRSWALVHAVTSISLRADQVVGGTAINFLAAGITGYVFVDHYGARGTPSEVARSPEVTLPGIESVSFFGDAIGEANILTWIVLLLVPLISVYLFRTASGLRLRSVGEKPRAADVAGVPVLRTRYLAVIASGALAALGGAYLSIGLIGSFNQLMTDGRGFIALAAVIFGSWRPGMALVGCFLFGFSSAIAQRLPVFSDSLAVLFQALPYVVTLVVVAGVIGRSRPPAAIGVPYVKE